MMAPGLRERVEGPVVAAVAAAAVAVPLGLLVLQLACGGDAQHGNDHVSGTTTSTQSCTFCTVALLTREHEMTLARESFLDGGLICVPDYNIFKRRRVAVFPG